MKWPRTRELLANHGLSAATLDEIAAGSVDWDLVSFESEEDGCCDLLLTDIDTGGTAQGPRLTAAEVDEILSTWEFERRDGLRADRPATFDAGDYDDWTGIRPGSDWQGMIRDYRAGIVAMADSLPADAGAPLLFLCRHTLELQLKAIIMVGQEAFSLRLDLPAHHELDRLWTAALPMILSGGFKGDLDSVRKLVDDYHAADPNSFSFRYPVTPKNKPVQRESFLQAFGKKQHMELVNEVFDRLDEAIRKLHMRGLFRRISEA